MDVQIVHPKCGRRGVWHDREKGYYCYTCREWITAREVDAQIQPARLAALEKLTPKIRHGS